MMYLLVSIALMTFLPEELNAKQAEVNYGVSESLSFDTSKVLTLIKNGVDGLSKEFPEKTIIIEFSPAKGTTVIFANILVDAQLVFIYTIETKGYSIVGYKDLRQEKRKEISAD
jgi:hypothetical protein